MNKCAGCNARPYCVDVDKALKNLDVAIRELKVASRESMLNVMEVETAISNVHKEHEEKTARFCTAMKAIANDI